MLIDDSIDHASDVSPEHGLQGNESGRSNCTSTLAGSMMLRQMITAFTSSADYCENCTSPRRWLRVLATCCYVFPTDNSTSYRCMEVCYHLRLRSD